MNPELYERYLAKKAKKLGITVEELKAQGTSSPVSEPSVTSSNTEQTISQEPQQSVQVEPQNVQRTIQDQFLLMFLDLQKFRKLQNIIVVL